MANSLKILSRLGSYPAADDEVSPAISKLPREHQERSS